MKGNKILSLIIFNICFLLSVPVFANLPIPPSPNQSGIAYNFINEQSIPCFWIQDEVSGDYYLLDDKFTIISQISSSTDVLSESESFFGASPPSVSYWQFD